MANLWFTVECLMIPQPTYVLYEAVTGKHRTHFSGVNHHLQLSSHYRTSTDIVVRQESKILN